MHKLRELLLEINKNINPIAKDNYSYNAISVELSEQLKRYTLTELLDYSGNLYEQVSNHLNYGRYHYMKTLYDIGYKTEEFDENIQSLLLTLDECENSLLKNMLYVYVIKNHKDMAFPQFWNLIRSSQKARHAQDDFLVLSVINELEIIAKKDTNLKSVVFEDISLLTQDFFTRVDKKIDEDYVVHSYDENHILDDGNVYSECVRIKEMQSFVDNIGGRFKVPYFNIYNKYLSGIEEDFNRALFYDKNNVDVDLMMSKFKDCSDEQRIHLFNRFIDSKIIELKSIAILNHEILLNVENKPQKNKKSVLTKF